MSYGVLNTYFRKVDRKYDDTKYWDNIFYTDGISDSKTISKNKSLITTKYHYNSMESLILKHLRNNLISIHNSHILDIGSGSGHWIDFYVSLDAGVITGIDVSNTSFNYLNKKYTNNPNIKIYQGRALEVINKLNSTYDVVNAVGVMFHIVDDFKWQNTIYSIGKVINKGGIFIIGGHFGIFNGLNVQIDNNGINKRLKSRKHWKKILKRAGFIHVKFYRNYSYLKINDTIPENNVLIATK